MSCYVTCRMPRRSTPRSLLWWQARREVRVGKPGSFSSLPSENTNVPLRSTDQWDFTSSPMISRLASADRMALDWQKNARPNCQFRHRALIDISGPCCFHPFQLLLWDSALGHWTSADIWIAVCAKKGRRARSWHISRRKMLLHFLPTTISTNPQWECSKTEQPL